MGTSKYGFCSRISTVMKMVLTEWVGVQVSHENCPLGVKQE